MTNFSFSRSVSLFIPFKPRLVKVFFFFFFTLCKSLLFFNVIENLSGPRLLINLLVCIIFFPFFKSHVLLYKNHREESGYDVHVFKYYRVNNAATSFVAVGSPRTQCDWDALSMHIVRVVALRSEKQAVETKLGRPGSAYKSLQ